MMKKLTFCLILCVVSALQISAQTLLVNDKIPDDLLIKLTTQGSWGGIISEMTINAKGELAYQSRGSGNMPPGIPFKSLLASTINGKRIKEPKYLKPQISAEKLKSLIAEFEKIEFFRFGKDFPQTDESEGIVTTDMGNETISIRINGQTKEVYNYLGEYSKRNQMLRNLAERIRGASVWNYENGAIPENFLVSYRLTEGDKIQKEFKINAQGKITESIYSSRFYLQQGKELAVLIKNRTVGKSSEQKVRQLIDEFEKAAFSSFRFSTLNKYSGCTNEAPATAEKRTHLSVQINYVNIYASLYDNCAPKPETEAAKFEYMSAIVAKYLKDANVLK